MPRLYCNKCSKYFISQLKLEIHCNKFHNTNLVNYTQEQSIKSILIQKYFRRYYIKLLKDCMTKEIVIELLNRYIDNQLF
jgi:hypothetical protein